MPSAARTAIGRIHFDDFSSNTAANYDPVLSTISVSSGVMNIPTSIERVLHPGGGKEARFVTLKGSYTGSKVPGPLLNNNAALSAAADVDGYCMYWTGGAWCLRRLTNNVLTTIGTDTTTESPSAACWTRLVSTGNYLYPLATVDTTKFVLTQNGVSDTTYARPLYAGIAVPASTDFTVDDFESRTDIFVFFSSGLPNGYYLRLTDAYGNTQDSVGGAAAGANSVTGSYLHMPLASIKVYDADPATTGVLKLTLLLADYPEMGAGDYYTYDPVTYFSATLACTSGSVAGFQRYGKRGLLVPVAVAASLQKQGVKSLLAVSPTVAGVALVRVGKGLLDLDDFSTDTSANYVASAGTVVVSGGKLMATGVSATIVRQGISGVGCATSRGTLGSGGRLVGPALIQNENPAVAANCDGYTSIAVPSSQWYWRKLVDGAYSNLATDGNGLPTTVTIQRIMLKAAGVAFRAGLTVLAGGVAYDSSDLTYTAKRYGGLFSGGVANTEWEDLELRTDYRIMVAGLVAGWYAKVSDGATTAKAAAVAGTATVDCSVVLFPLASVAVYNGDPDAGGALVASVSSASLADMGGGDSFVFSASLFSRVAKVVRSATSACTATVQRKGLRGLAAVSASVVSFLGEKLAVGGTLYYLTLECVSGASASLQKRALVGRSAGSASVGSLNRKALVTRAAVSVAGASVRRMVAKNPPVVTPGTSASLSRKVSKTLQASSVATVGVSKWRSVTFTAVSGAVSWLGTQLLRLTHQHDVVQCPRCGARQPDPFMTLCRKCRFELGGVSDGHHKGGSFLG